MSRFDTVLKPYHEQKELVDLKISTGIEVNRKGNARLEFVTESGKTPENITIEVEQVSHEFKFGANIFMLDEFEKDEKNAIYREKFPELFNLATVPFYWEDLEPEEGKPRYAKGSPRVYRRPAPDLCIEYCKQHDIEPKCHCLNYDQVAPMWAARKPLAEYKKTLEKRFRELSERYSKSIPSWEVTNEVIREGRTKFYYEDDYMDWNYRMADKYFPNNRLIINDYLLPTWFLRTYNTRNPYYMVIDKLLRGGITHLDAIGMQFHHFYPLKDEAGKAYDRYNPENVYRTLDLFGRFNLPEQVTEMTVSAYGDDDENEAIQAELTTMMYSVFFSHPAMEAIIYWNLVDGYAAYAPIGDMTVGENQYYGGFLHHDMSEKPVYRELKKLINEKWHTSITIQAQSGIGNFRGFYGDYRLKVHYDEKVMDVDLKLAKKADNKFKIVLK